MTNPRKQIIINEISFWKQSKLLPEHYCDFLMTLYSEGEFDEEEVKQAAKKSIKAQERRFNWTYVLLPVCAFIAMLALLLLNPSATLIVVGFIAGIVLVGSALYMMKRNNLLAPLLQLSAALVLLGSSIQLCAKYFAGNDIALYVALILNCLVWFLSGLYMKLAYFTIAGGLGLIAIIVYSVV